MSTFRPNCTLPPSIVNYVKGATARGTLDIAWSSLSAVILCTWTVLHLNVPVQIRPRNMREKIALGFQIMLRKLKWMALMVVAPEFMLGKATVDLLSAHFYNEEMKSWSTEGEWSMTHAHVANMGGFALEFPPEVQTSLAVVGKDGDDRNGQPVDQRGSDARGDGDLSQGEKTAEHALESENASARSMSLPEKVEESRKCKETTPSGENSERIANADTSTAAETTARESGETAMDIGTTKDLGEDSDDDLNEDDMLRDTYNQRLHSPPPRYGREVWLLDETNARLVSTAMRQLLRRDPSIRLRSRQWNLLALQGSMWILDAAQLHLARKLGILRQLPNIHEQDLQDQNKGDFLVKALAVVQGTLVVVQLIVRYAKGLPSSQLELVAGAFAGCSIFTYLLFWFKPKDVGTLRYFPAARYPTAKEVLEIATEGPTTFFHYRKGYWIPNNAVHRVRWSTGKAPDSADRYPRFSFLIASGVGAVIFGAPHLLAWDFAFPTTIERTLWRVAASLTVILPFSGLVADGLFSWLYKRRARYQRVKQPGPFQMKFLSTVAKIIWIFALPYFLARLYIIVAVFRSLFFLPPLTFMTTWSSSTPHLAY